MLTEFEIRIVKSLETIAECSLKQSQIAEEAMKKTQELYKANMAMIEERYDKELKIEHTPIKIELDNGQMLMGGLDGT